MPVFSLNKAAGRGQPEELTPTAPWRSGIPTMKCYSLILTGCLGLMLSSCGGEKTGALAPSSAPTTAPAAAAPAAPAASAAPPPPQVGVVKVQLEEASLVNELPGRLEALRVAQVRARVAGVVQKRLFQEGSKVKAGQILYQLDPAPFRASLDSALATVRKAEANLMQASAQVERFKPLLESNAVSQQEYTNALAAQKQAEADIASGRAAVQTARINLGYATVSASIEGRIGRSLVTEGALVGQGETTQMAVIQQIDPLFVNFTQPVSELLRLKQSIASGKLKQGGASASAPVGVTLEDGSVYPHTGKLLFTDLSVDQNSGQVSMRAELPNPDNLLLPGMYVRVRIEQARYESVALLPQQAVTRGAQGDLVNVVDDKGVVSSRSVKLGGAQGNRWIITEGLKPDEQVMVDGFQKLRPGISVKAVPWQANMPTTPAGSPNVPSAPNAQSSAK